MDVQSLDHSVQVLQQNKGAWARLPLTRKIEYLDGIRRRYAAVAARQVADANRAKGIEDGTRRAGEEWAHAYVPMRLLRLLGRTLSDIASQGRVRLPRGAVRTRPNGRAAARVFPLNLPDTLLFQGFRGEIWMQPGVTEDNLAQHMASTLLKPETEGKVALVLAAGNVASIGPADLIHKLFVEGRVCVLKHNPVADYLGPVIDEAFADLIRDGFVRVAFGGKETGDYLCRHPGIDEMHLTGSDRTYEAIVFGPGEEGLRRKREKRPVLAKRFTCELGNVSPTIVVPGRWSRSDILFHAENIATQMIQNCGFNCLSTRVLVLAKQWPQAPDLMNAVRAALASTPPQKAFYPGAEERYEQVLAAHPQAEKIGARSPGVLPYTLVAGLDPAARDNPCFASECFMPLLAQTSLPGTSVEEFLANAVSFCNQTLWGTLSASIIVHPSEQKRLGPALEETIEALRYGTVAVNQWTALGYLWGSTTWGAWPGHTPDDIQSGIGFVHNTFLFDKPEKSVVYGPFRVWPKPAWSMTNRQTHRVFPRLFELEQSPSAGKALRIALVAMSA